MLLAMLDWTECAAVERVPGKVSGAWVFKNIQVPVRALFENIEDGATANDFLAWFPGVSREQVEAVLEHAERSLTAAWVCSGPCHRATAHSGRRFPHHSPSEQPVVFVVRADPEPGDRACGFDADGSVIVADASDPVAANLLEMQGWMPVIVTPEAIRFVGQLPGLG
jgi:uncharacterized protein (DUF433 family)